MINIEMQYAEFTPVSRGGLMMVDAWVDMTDKQIIEAMNDMAQNIPDHKLREWIEGQLEYLPDSFEEKIAEKNREIGRAA